MNIYFITGNENKYNEAKFFINNLEQLKIDLPEIQSDDPEEIIKAKLLAASQKCKNDIITEDTSLYFDCLPGLPGPLIKWFLKSLGGEGLYDLAKKYNNFHARAEAIVGLKQGEDIQFFRGLVKGRIVSPRGQSNFGWDPIFVPEGYDKSFAEMSKEEKNQISHRRLAFIELAKYLNNN